MNTEIFTLIVAIYSSLHPNYDRKPHEFATFIGARAEQECKDAAAHLEAMKLTRGPFSERGREYIEQTVAICVRRSITPGPMA